MNIQSFQNNYSNPQYNFKSWGTNKMTQDAVKLMEREIEKGKFSGLKQKFNQIKNSSLVYTFEKRNPKNPKLVTFLRTGNNGVENVLERYVEGVMDPAVVVAKLPFHSII